MNKKRSVIYKQMSETIRVLQVVTCMDRGGLETMIMNYYRNIDRTCVQFDFLTHRPEDQVRDYDEEIRSLGGRIYHVSKLNPFSYLYHKELYCFFRDHPEYRIIHVHQDCMSAIALHMARKAGVKVRIAHCHNSNQDFNAKYFIKRVYRRFIRREATDLFACGRQAGRWMLCTDDFTVINNAIDAKSYSFNETVRRKVRDDFGIGNEFVVGHVGRFSEVKNHPFLLEIYERILEHEKDSRLLLVGTGENEEIIKKLVSSRKLGKNVIFAGSRSDVNELMSAMDVFVLPSLYEGLPVTTIEAQAAGLPVFISDKVPIDCKITDDVYQLPLSETPEFWAKQILSVKGRKRKDNYFSIVDANYDICTNAKQLQEFYLNKAHIV